MAKCLCIRCIGTVSQKRCRKLGQFKEEEEKMSCCTRKRSKKEILFLPMAIGGTLGFFAMLLTIEMSIAYALGFI